MSTDDEQNRRIGDVEKRINELENNVAAMIAKIDTLISIGKGLVMMVGIALGVDVMPMLGV